MANCVNAKHKDKIDKQIPWGTYKTAAKNDFLQNISDYWKFM